MANINMKALLETGVHFGHRTRKWNPRMKPYIFTERNGIHIIDLQQTLEAIQIADKLIRDAIEAGGTILFVGTKRQAQETIELEATRCGMSYVNSRWLGGTLTNWRTIRSRITELENLENRRDEGEFELLTKKEALNMRRKIDRLEERLGGIRNMKGIPNLVFVVDVNREETAIHEANLLKIPVIALVDTNCDPRGVDYVIPSNDDAIRAIKLLTSIVADTVLEGIAMRKDDEEFEAGEGVPTEVPEVELSDEELLGEATLAKLQSGEYDERSRSEATEATAIEGELEVTEVPEGEAGVDVAEVVPEPVAESEEAGVEAAEVVLEPVAESEEAEKVIEEADLSDVEEVEELEVEADSVEDTSLESNASEDVEQENLEIEVPEEEEE
jgi:small subunit ribosomal protein S2